MNKVIVSVGVTSLLAFGLSIAPAQAQLSRTYVSAAVGNDGNNCDRPTPCRTFQGAHEKTNSDGEITVLDPGGYGAVSITKSISIVNDGGGEASILVSGGGNGITVIAGPASYVNLRGITVQGIGFGGGHGIQLNSAFALTITNCVIRNLNTRGLSLSPSVSSPNTTQIVVSDTLVADNGAEGIIIIPSGNGVVRGVLTRVQSVNNSSDGIFVTGSSSNGAVKVTVQDSVAANNGSFGLRGSSAAATTAVMAIGSSLVNNNVGVVADGGSASVRLGRSVITGNNTSTQIMGGASLSSYGDNNIDGNGNAPEPVLPVIAKK